MIHTSTNQAEGSKEIMMDSFPSMDKPEVSIHDINVFLPIPIAEGSLVIVTDQSHRTLTLNFYHDST